MKFVISKGVWDYSVILAVLKLDGMFGTKGVDYLPYKSGSYEADSIETGVDLTEGIVLYRVPSVHFELDTVWMAVIRDSKVSSDKPLTGN